MSERRTFDPIFGGFMIGAAGLAGVEGLNGGIPLILKGIGGFIINFFFHHISVIVAGS